MPETPAKAPTAADPFTTAGGTASTQIEVELTPAPAAPTPKAAEFVPLAIAPFPTAVAPVPDALAWQFTRGSKSVLGTVAELRPGLATGGSASRRVVRPQHATNAMRGMRKFMVVARLV